MSMKGYVGTRSDWKEIRSLSYSLKPVLFPKSYSGNTT